MAQQSPHMLAIIDFQAMQYIYLAYIAIWFLTIWMQWRIFAKAGFSGALSLLLLVPGFGFLIAMGILAFSTWPTEPRHRNS
jgi:hypothetical protein